MMFLFLCAVILLSILHQSITYIIVQTASNPMPMSVTSTVSSARHPHGTYEIRLSAATFLSWHGSTAHIA